MAFWRAKKQDSSSFFKACYQLIFVWVILELAIAVAAVAYLGDRTRYGFFVPLVLCCVIEFGCGVIFVPKLFSIARDEAYVEKAAKKIFLHMKGIIFLNLVISILFMVWAGTSKDQSASVAGAWAFWGTLLMGSILAKYLFIQKYIQLKRYAKALNVYCEPEPGQVDPRGEAEVEVIREAMILEDQPTQSVEVAKLENKETKT